MSVIGDVVRSVRERVVRPDKEESELSFWRSRAKAEGLGSDGVITLDHAHYERVFTQHFELTPDFFDGKRILDIGCGPRGTLEWATGAAERVGVDPLVNEYREFGIEHHAMAYVDAPAEKLPFPDGHFDVVTILNALDHVEDLKATIAEISRVAADGGTILITVEVRHKPTAAEPHWIDWDLVESFPDCKVEWTARNGVRWDHNIFRSIEEDKRYARGRGILRARLRRGARTASR